MLSSVIETILLFFVHNLRRLLPLMKPKQTVIPAPMLPPSGSVMLGQQLRSALERMRYPNAEAEPVLLNPAMLRKHCYILGGTGSGKSTLIKRMVDLHLQTRTGFVVFDLRGDLVEDILRMAAAAMTPQEIADGRLLLLDCNDDEHITGLNPLRGEGDAHNRAGALHSVLKENSESWGIQLDETLKCSLICLAELAARDPAYSLVDLEPFLLNDPFRRESLRLVTDDYALAFFERYENLSPEQRQSYALAVLNKAAPFLSHPTLRMLLGTSPTFSLSELLNERDGQIILINLAVHRFHEAAFVLGAFLVTMLQNIFAARIALPEQERRPVGVILDEFENFGVGRFGEMVAENRKLRAHLVLAHQNLSQLDNRLRLTLLENCGAQYFFQCGAHDAGILSQEIHSEDPREMVKTALMRQQVGECHFSLKGEPTIRMRVQSQPTPAIAEATLQAIREASWHLYSRPREEAERSLAARRARQQSVSFPCQPPQQTPTPRPRPRSRPASTAAGTASQHQPAETNPVSGPDRDSEASSTVEVIDYDDTPETPKPARKRRASP